MSDTKEIILLGLALWGLTSTVLFLMRWFGIALRHRHDERELRQRLRKLLKEYHEEYHEEYDSDDPTKLPR